VDLFYTLYQYKYNIYCLNKTLNNGTQPEVAISCSEYFSRPEMVEQLKNIFKPHKGQSFYHVIYGTLRIGKSTLVKTASKEVGQGVIYVEIPADCNLNGAFKKALNISFNKYSFVKRIAQGFLVGKPAIRFSLPIFLLN
jgi:hypothetical protein